ncbi:hypothetical protein DXD81_09730 [Blautia obeum]|nr:hypothetical protein DXD81_09730 [Blautia obeum]DAF15600.1 MAG TPA: hypothetical protein [Caudoviricetes sp.]
MNFRSWQRWQLIEYALLQKISEEKAVENGKALPQTKQEFWAAYRIYFCSFQYTVHHIHVVANVSLLYSPSVF